MSTQYSHQRSGRSSSCTTTTSCATACAVGTNSASTDHQACGWDAEPPPRAAQPEANGCAQRAPPPSRWAQGQEEAGAAALRRLHSGPHASPRKQTHTQMRQRKPWPRGAARCPLPPPPPRRPPLRQVTRIWQISSTLSLLATRTTTSTAARYCAALSIIIINSYICNSK
jgi:hypothetical protein